MSNNSHLTEIIAMMPAFNTHDLDPTRAEPKAELVQQFFDNLSKGSIHAELELIRPTTDEEVAYITARADEVALAAEAGSYDTVVDEAREAEEERKFLEWMGPAGETSGAAGRAPLLKKRRKSRPRRHPRQMSPRPRRRGASCDGPAPTSQSTLARLRSDKELRRSPCAR